MAAETIDRVAMTDDSGGGTDGTVLNDAWLDASIYDQIDEFWDNTKGLYLDTSGFLALNETANANMTIGLTINQGASDDHALGLKSSDVATGLSTIPVFQDVETDDYGVFAKRHSANGGLVMVALGESGDDDPFYLETWGGAPLTTDTSSSRAAMNLIAGEHDGANAAQDMAADSNLLMVGEINSSSIPQTRLILKADDGELHLGNTTLVALDDEDDVGLVRAMQWEASGGKGMQPMPWNTADYGVPPFSYEKLRAVGVLGERDADGFCLFRVQPRFAMNEGAIWQLACQTHVLAEQDDALVAWCGRLESRLLRLEA